MIGNTMRKGFTLVELSLSMVFIGVLSVSVVLIISNTVSAYQRGLTLSRVNSTGTDLSDDMRVSVQASSVKSLLNTCDANIFRNGDVTTSLKKSSDCKTDKAYRYVFAVKRVDVKIGTDKNNLDEESGVPIYGAFCTGSYSYVWNSGYFESDNATFGEKANGWLKIQYLSGSEGQTATTWNEGKLFRLLKIKDEMRAICIALTDKTGSEYNVSQSDIPNIIDITGIGPGTIKEDDIVDLLPITNGSDLAVYDLSVARPAISTSNDNVFYAVSLILGTTTGGINIMSRGNSCSAPNDTANAGNYNYCAINKFNFALQVNGG